MLLPHISNRPMTSELTTIRKSRYAVEAGDDIHTFTVGATYYGEPPLFPRRTKWFASNAPPSLSGLLRSMKLSSPTDGTIHSGENWELPRRSKIKCTGLDRNGKFGLQTGRSIANAKGTPSPTATEPHGALFLCLLIRRSCLDSAQIRRSCSEPIKKPPLRMAEIALWDRAFRHRGDRIRTCGILLPKPIADSGCD